jgi:hypothetical protein
MQGPQSCRLEDARAELAVTWSRHSGHNARGDPPSFRKRACRLRGDQDPYRRGHHRYRQCRRDREVVRGHWSLPHVGDHCHPASARNRREGSCARCRLTLPATELATSSQCGLLADRQACCIQMLGSR